MRRDKMNEKELEHIEEETTIGLGEDGKDEHDK